MKLPKIKVRRTRRPALPILSAPHRPRFDNGNEPELFEGSIQGKKASQPEERFAKALNKNKVVDGYEFRYTIGAPRGMPGWKEIDFLVNVRGMVYAFECDTAFTHRDKGVADKLHDAIAIKSLNGQGMNLFPQIIHLDGERELDTPKNAERTVKRLFA